LDIYITVVVVVLKLQPMKKLSQSRADMRGKIWGRRE